MMCCTIEIASFTDVWCKAIVVWMWSKHWCRIHCLTNASRCQQLMRILKESKNILKVVVECVFRHHYVDFWYVMYVMLCIRLRVRCNQLSVCKCMFLMRLWFTGNTWRCINVFWCIDQCIDWLIDWYSIFVCICHSNTEELDIVYTWLHNENSAQVKGSSALVTFICVSS